ncbi:MAG: methyl-accepting chemotaxis protein [Calditrichaeota bacterium]|nr:MAG: methyl-accepting chemotaxis protein [Calditrichota bacterium]
MRTLKRINSLPLKQKFLLLFILVVGINWVIIYVQHHFGYELIRKEFEKRGKFLAQTIATQAEFALVMENKEELDTLLDNIIGSGHANAAGFFDKDGHLLAERNLNLLPYNTRALQKLLNQPQWSTTVNGIPILLSAEEVIYRADQQRVGYFLVSLPALTIQKQEVTARWISILGLVCFLGFIILAMVLLNKYVIHPILNLQEAASQVASGNFDIDVRCNNEDELGTLANAFTTMISKNRAMLTELKEKQEEAEKARDYAEMMQKRSEEQQEYLEAQFQRIEEVISAVTRGDLTRELQVERDDVVGKLIKKINQMMADLRNLIAEVHSAGESVAQASSQISISAEGMSAGAREQAEQTSEVAAAIEEMSRTILETSRNAAEAVELARNAASLANKGEQDFNETLSGMKTIAQIVTDSANVVNTLGESSTQIGEIIQVIDEIADQTNLLALNAAIEAARAGQHGKGFAVVADEVRKLAERTTAATKEIVEMITRIQKDTQQVVQSMTRGTEEVEKGMKLADTASTSLSNIVASVNDIVNRINQIAAASHQQSSTSEEISRNVERISSVADQIFHSTNTLSLTSENLSKLTEHLQELIERFTIHKELHTSAPSVGNGKSVFNN